MLFSLQAHWWVILLAILALSAVMGCTICLCGRTLATDDLQWPLTFFTPITSRNTRDFRMMQSVFHRGMLKPLNKEEPSHITNTCRLRSTHQWVTWVTCGHTRTRWLCLCCQLICLYVTTHLAFLVLGSLHFNIGESLVTRMFWKTLGSLPSMASVKTISTH